MPKESSDQSTIDAAGRSRRASPKTKTTPTSITGIASCLAVGEFSAMNKPVLTSSVHDDEGMDQTYVVAKALLWKHHRLGDVKVGGVLLAACSRALSRHWLAGRVPQVYSVQHAH